MPRTQRQRRDLIAILQQRRREPKERRAFMTVDGETFLTANNETFKVRG